MHVRRLTLAIALGVAASAPGAARAETFAAGSLIIPLDECFQYNAASQSGRLGWNSGTLPNAINSSYSSTFTSGSTCIALDTSSTAVDGGTSGDPYYPKCWMASSAITP